MTENMVGKEVPNPLKLGVGVLPAREQQEILIDLSKQISQRYRFSYNLDGVNFVPHVSLYQAKFHDLRTARRSLEEVMERVSTPELVVDNIGIFAKNFVFLDLVRTGSLQELHQETVQAWNKARLKDSSSFAKDQNLEGLKPIDIENFERFGYPFVGEAFRPHFTMGRVTDENPNLEEVRQLAAQALADIKSLPITPEKLVIYEMGIDGACVRILKEYPFKK